MISNELQKAIDHLNIKDVYLSDHLATFVNDFNPKYYEGIDDLTVEFMHIVKRSVLFAAPDETQLVQINIRLGTRWVDRRSSEEEAEEEKADGDEAEANIKAVIEAEYIAEYELKESLERKCIDEFALKNASVHVWPYWRELLASQCSRMNLPKIILPAVQFASNRDDGAEDIEADLV